MMLEVGQIFNKKGKTLCVLKKLKYNNKEYALISVEDNKLEYLFYEITLIDDNYKLNLVTDSNLEYKLFEIIEGENDE